MCVRACVRACVHVCVRACVRVCVFVCVCAARGVAWIWEEHGVCRASLAWISEVSMLIHHVQTWLQPWHVLSFLHLPSLFSCSFWCNTDYLLVAASNLLHSCSVVGVLVLYVQCTCSSSCGSTTSVYRRTMYTVSCHVHCVLSCTLCPVCQLSFPCYGGHTRDSLTPPELTPGETGHSVCRREHPTCWKYMYLLHFTYQCNCCLCY